MNRLTADQIKALRLIKNGADIYNYLLAKTLRAIEEYHPELISIGKPQMYRGDGADQVPYFGAIVTAAGKAAISTKKKKVAK